MSFRTAGLALAALLILLWVIAHRSRVEAPPAAPAVPVAAPAPPPRPARPAAKAPRKTVAKAPAAPAKIRGAKLREKGEAFGGGTPDQ